MIDITMDFNAVRGFNEQNCVNSVKHIESIFIFMLLLTFKRLKFIFYFMK
jgi:hypothetical protein